MFFELLFHPGTMLGAGDSDNRVRVHIGRGWSAALTSVINVFSFLNSFVLSIPAPGGTRGRA